MQSNTGDARGQQNTRTPLSSNHRDAISLLQSGVYPIPLCWSDTPGAMRCACPGEHTEKLGAVREDGVREDVRYRSIGKTPLVEWQKYQSDPPGGPDVHAWWRRWPNANIAILLEPSNLLVVDIDSHTAEMEVRRNGIGGGAVVVRGGKIKHIYYTRPEGIDITRRTRVGDSGKIDILPSGYVVAPPSVHGDGLEYSWEGGYAPDFDELPEPPAWVLDQLAEISANGDVMEYSGDLSGEVVGFEPMSKREERIASALSTLSPNCSRSQWIRIAAMLVDGFDRGADADERRTSLARGFDLWAAWSSSEAYTGVYDHDEAKKQWASLPTRQRKRRAAFAKLKEQRETEGRELTIDDRRRGATSLGSLFREAHNSKTGWVDPHPPHGIITECEVSYVNISDEDLVEPDHLKVVPMTRAAAPPNNDAPTPQHGGGGNGGGGGGNITKYPEIVWARSDMEYAELVAAFVRGDSPAPIIYDEGSVWRYTEEESRWAPISDDAVRHATRWLDGVMVGSRDEQGQIQTKPKRLSYSALSSISRSVPVVSLHEEFFSNAPRGAQFRNAFVRVDRDGVLHVCDPGPSHRQRLGVRFDYNPAAPCDLWKMSLMQWLTPSNADEDDPDYINPVESCNEAMDFLQEFIGVTLMGWAPKFQMMVVLIGEGSNGKSVLMDVIASLFPEEVTSNTPPQDFTGPQMQNAVANMAGKRICYFADIPANELVNSSKLKALISGDKIEGRAVYEKTKKFRPEAGFLYSANELPTSRDNSHGFWRRATAIPFTNRFSPDDDGFDPDLTAKLLAEREGIYAWAVEGARRALERGKLAVPRVSTQKMAEWRVESNPMERWAEDCVECVSVPVASDPDHWSTSSWLYPSYVAWCEHNNHRPFSSTKFARGLGRVVGQAARKRYYNRLRDHAGIPEPQKSVRCYQATLNADARRQIGL